MPGHDRETLAARLSKAAGAPVRAIIAPVVAMWGPNLFGPHERDDIDGARVAGLVVRRGPDGTLVAIQEDRKDD